MTLKQFIVLAIGLVIALVFYSSPLYWFIKWPLLIISVMGGFAFAFIPIEERPLEIWFAAFFKAVYTPTQYLWKKSNPAPEILTIKSAAKPLPVVEIVAPQGKERLDEYLNSLPQNAPTVQEQQNHDYLQKINGLFNSTNLPPSITPSVTPINEPLSQPSLEPHPLGSPPSDFPVIKPIDPTPPPPPPPPPTPSVIAQTDSPHTVFTAPVVSPHNDSAVKKATFSLDIPIPITPTAPNLVVGMVLTAEGKIVENAILEIRDSASGHPVRAMKTNKIGQFSIITPLKVGKYDIITEKDNLEFEPVSFEVKNEIIPPIEIRAKPASISNNP